ncbi:MAG: EAL domain-containing protein [Telmatospirillum sp.]|nr:EAL domain-containing protein [Telmatospirillum sp.]
MGKVAAPLSIAVDSLALMDAVAHAVLAVDSYGTVAFANRAAREMFAADDKTLDDTDMARLVPALAERWRGGIAVGTFATDANACDGRMFPVQLTVARCGDTAAPWHIVTVRDQSEQLETERRIAAQGLRDPLTGLAARALFLEQIGTALAQRASGRALAVACLGLDRFKSVNDSLGFLAGDTLLQQVAARLAVEFGAEVSLARLGGDEFGLLIADAPREADIAVVAERALGVFSAHFALGGREVSASASVGLAFAGADAQKPDSAQRLLSNADIAMLRAKRTGGRRIEIFEPSRHGEALGLLEIELAMRDALQANEFEVVYQPIVALANGRLCGVEALLRWRRDGIDISPSVFIPIAEESGLIVEIGAFVLRRACAQMAQWRREFGAAAPGYVSVNLSARQLDRDDVPALVGTVLAETGLAASDLELELTESTVVQNADAGRDVLRAVVGQGVALSIDDFGTGQSSLSQLPRLPISKIKIDRAFVGRMDSESECFEIVRIIVSLANALGMVTVAEGIERESQAVLLRQLGCRYGQGYLFDRPRNADGIARLCANAASLPAAATQAVG